MRPHPAHAAALPASLPNAASLKLPRTAFPKGATVRTGKSGNLAADTASTLHTQSMTSLGRVGGVIQTAGWNVVSRRARHAVSIQYVASIFPTEDEAAGAYDDARISLWENGRPQHVQPLQSPVFAVQERSGHTSVHVVAYHGQVELELHVRYLRTLDANAIHASLAGLGHAAQVANRLAQKLVAPPASPGTQQLQVVAPPLGVGPVVKSPSLLTIDTPTVGSTAQLYPGSFRTTSPRLTGTSVNRPSLATNGSVLRYARTMRDPSGAEVYNTAALFATPTAATGALTDVAAANDAGGFHRVDTSMWRGSLAYLGAADNVIMWQGPSEGILAFRQGNVVEMLANTSGGPAALAPLADRLAAAIPSWLATQGTQIVDRAGHPVYLNGLNWYGAEESDFVVGGLDYAPYQTILNSMAQHGFNSIRIPFSNQMVEQNPVITAHLAANSSLEGLHALDILDHIVQYAGAVGLSVILDDHRTTAGWSSQPSGLWYDDAYPDTSFVRDWSMLAQRYAVSNVVIGADLFNEPHAAATWGDGNLATDWRLAAQRAGNAALAVNPHLLIMVEGVQFYGGAPSYWWGGNLMGVATAPVLLQYASGTQAHDRLVYSVHDYGPNMCGAGCPWFNATTTYDSLAAVWDQYWGYISADPTKSYAAPLWIGEFGTCNQTQDCVQSSVPGSQGQWFSSLVQYIGVKKLGWTYWPANGTMSTGGTRVYGNLDFYGYFTQDWGAPVPWLDTILHTIQNVGGSGSPSTP